jgi:hypothetical protein
MAEEKWERCKICGLEWPDNSLAECPQYRNTEHRKCRTNVRSQDVASFTKIVDGEPATSELAVADPDPKSEAADGAVGDALWPLKGTNV